MPLEVCWGTLVGPDPLVEDYWCKKKCVQRHTVLLSCTHTFYCLAAAVWNADFMHFIHFVQLMIAQFSSTFVSSPFELHTNLVLVSTKYYKNKNVYHTHRKKLQLIYWGYQNPMCSVWRCGAHLATENSVLLKFLDVWFLLVPTPTSCYTCWL